jgi:lipoprotein-releasing system ATP-binding protein
MSEPIIVCEDLSKTFRTDAEELHILRSIDLSVEAGATASITGPSGCGKTTLLSILGGLDSPGGGRLRVGPWNLHELGEDGLSEYRSSFVGFVFQFHYLLKDFTALENVALPAYMRGLPRQEAFDRAAGLLADLGLGDRKHQYPGKLSGGERQRAAIARALVNRPSVILADEPTGNLDEANARAVEDLLLGLAPEYGATLVVVTHDARFASRTDQRFRLTEGEIEAP